jgi:hypothetical protein
VLEAPVPLPGVQLPDSPYLGSAEPTLSSSKGFEGMARGKGGRYQYRMDDPSYSIGDLTELDNNRFLVIERDQNQGAAAVFKRIYLVDRRDVGPGGFLVKHEVVDLMHLNDPNLLSLPARPGDIGLGSVFTFPFQTIEDVLPLGKNRLLVVNDDNVPFSNGRNPGLPDDDEFIVLKVPGLKGT